MCGIFAVVNDSGNQAAQTVMEGLKILEYRGYDSWGIALIDQKLKIKDKKFRKYIKKIIIEKHVGKIGKAKTVLPAGRTAIGHTRWATHGGVTARNAHPHLDCTGTLAVIHNGIIENYRELKQDLAIKGHKFVSETDSEIAAHLIEQELKNKDIKKAVFSAFDKLKGLNAIVALDANSNTIVGCRYGSPLAVGLNQNEYFLASDAIAFANRAKKVIYLKDRQAVVMTSKSIKLYDLDKKKLVKPEIKELNLKKQDADKSGYRHFYLKEAMQEPGIIKNISEKPDKNIQKLAKVIKQAEKTIFFGCGSAYFCSLFAKYFFAEAGIDVQAFQAHEYEYFAKLADKNTLGIAISQSGETADTLLAAKALKAKKAELAGILNAKFSSLERLSDIVINVQAGPEIAVVSTKAFIAQLTYVYLLSRTVKGLYKKTCSDLALFAKNLNGFLKPAGMQKIKKLALKLADKQNIFVTGKNLNYPAGLEFALKLKEASYIHAEAFACGELKHGVISLIEQGTPCTVLADNLKYKADSLSSAEEVKARGGYIIGIAPFESEVFDYHVRVPDAGRLTCFANIIAGQMLAYFLSLVRGADPDKPRNLAKSVTVK